jgi:hypothetical protein
MQKGMIREVKRSPVIGEENPGDDPKWKNLALMGMAGSL